VIARNSSVSYKGGHVDIKEVGRALGARYVLEGSVAAMPGSVHSGLG
jgi:TolB-like protein